MTSKNRLHSVALALLGSASLLIGWQLIISVGLVSEASIPQPLAVLRALPTLLTDADFLSGAADTVTSWMTTVVLGSLAAVSIGLVTSSIPFSDARPAWR